MYGHASQPSRVYRYGAKPPRGEDADLIREQIDRSWRYRNDLVACELDRRAEAEEIVRRHDPRIRELDDDIEATESELEEARARIRDRNARARTKQPPDDPARVRELRSRLKQLRAELKKLRRAAYKTDAATADLKALDERDLDRRKRIRAESGLHWGTYLAVEQGLSGIRSGAPPRFIRRADWGGQVAVQAQGGATWDELLDGHGQCQVEMEPLPDGAKPGGRRSQRPYCRVSLRVGSEGRTPIWATVRCVLHRRVPADGRVKWVRIVRRVEGTREEWSVQFVVARESWARQDTHTAAGLAAINLGWRKVDGGVRVATLVAEDGATEELVVPAERMAGVDKADSLEGIRDREMTQAREALTRWLAVRHVPDWLEEDTATLDRWTAQARLASLVLRWRDRRFTGDRQIYARMEAWRVQDRHLCDWAAAERAKFRRWRKDAYRRWAASLRWTYETLIVEDTDYAALARRPEAEDDDEVLSTRRMARLASPGHLREIIDHGHPDVQRTSASGITQTCSTCGGGPAHDWDRVSEIEYRCEHGHVMDQDENAARNLLASAPGRDQCRDEAMEREEVDDG